MTSPCDIGTASRILATLQMPYIIRVDSVLERDNYPTLSRLLSCSRDCKTHPSAMFANSEAPLRKRNENKNSSSSWDLGAQNEDCRSRFVDLWDNSFILSVLTDWFHLQSLSWRYVFPWHYFSRCSGFHDDFHE